MRVCNDLIKIVNVTILHKIDASSISNQYCRQYYKIIIYIKSHWNLSHETSHDTCVHCFYIKYSVVHDLIHRAAISLPSNRYIYAKKTKKQSNKWTNDIFYAYTQKKISQMFKILLFLKNFSKWNGKIQWFEKLFFLNSNCFE